MAGSRVLNVNGAIYERILGYDFCNSERARRRGFGEVHLELTEFESGLMTIVNRETYSVFRRQYWWPVESSSNASYVRYTMSVSAL